MLRLTELKLPLDHSEPELRSAILEAAQDPFRSARRLHGLPPRLGCTQEIRHRADLFA